MADRMKKTLKTVDKYSDMPMLIEQGQTMEEWNDSNILIPASLPLVVLSDEDSMDMICKLLDGLSKSVTEVTAYEILLLTWNMRSETDATKRIFPVRAPQIVTGDPNQLSRIGSTPSGPGHRVQIPDGDEARSEFIRAGCFLAASLLKLFTKESNSWMLAYSHIMDSYKKFTDLTSPFVGFPNFDFAVGAIRRLYQTKPIYRNTLGMILYSLKQLVKGRGMTQMLFEQHLSFTGLHIVSLFCRAVVGLRTKPPLLMCALHTTSVEPTLDQLALIITSYMGNTDEGRSRETYKYSRLYNPKMFSLLQTKNCSDLVCILGHIGKLCGNIGAGDVMGIAALTQMSDEAKAVYQKIAMNIFNYFKLDVPAADKEMHQAILGGTVQVPTMSGNVVVKVRPGMQPGHKVLLKKKGIKVRNSYSFGDQYVHFIVSIPTNLTQRQPQVIEEFAKEDQAEEDDERAAASASG